MPGLLLLAWLKTVRGAGGRVSRGFLETGSLKQAALKAVILFVPVYEMRDSLR